MDNTPFAVRLRSLRQHAGLTVLELAERSGLHFTLLYALERGDKKHPRLETLRALAKGLGIEPGQLLM